MDDFLKAALEIVKAQASVRTMTEEEIVNLAQNLTASLKGIVGGECEAKAESVACDPGKAIREKSIICCECGKSFKILTKKHGYKKNLPLVCKGLQRERRKKMTEMKLWTKRGKKAAAAKPKAVKKA
jgi:predicted transcriptional regulator